MTPQQENEIIKFLRDDTSAKLDSVITNQGRLSNEFLLMRASVESDLKVFGHRLSGVEARVGSLEHDAEDTGTHNLADLKQQLDEARKASKEWIKTALFVAAALLGGSGVTAAVLKALGH